VKASNEKDARKIKGVAGSDPYISPEQWSEEEYDAFKADVWSCGMTISQLLYQCLKSKI
jgi:serine/threonine protein kinase